METKEKFILPENLFSGLYYHVITKTGYPVASFHTEENVKKFINELSGIHHYYVFVSGEGAMSIPYFMGK